MSNYKKEKKSLVFQNAFYDVDTGIITTPIKTRNYTLIQAADSYYLEGASIEEHVQVCDLEITYVNYGVLECYVNGKGKTAAAGEMHLTFKGEKHRIKSSGRCRFQTLAFNVNEGSEAEEELVSLNRISENTGVRKSVTTDGARAIADVLHEFYQPNMPFRTQAIESYISTVMIKIIRNLEYEGKKSKTDALDLLHSVANKIDVDYLKLRSVEEIQNEYNYSRSYLSRAFKSLNGQTMRDYLSNKKIHHAKELLKHGKSVREISLILGYSNPYNFSRAFKKAIGVSPKDYRESADKE